jgi:hypothetical protein
MVMTDQLDADSAAQIPSELPPLAASRDPSGPTGAAGAGNDGGGRIEIGLGLDECRPRQRPEGMTRRGLATGVTTREKSSMMEAPCALVGDPSDVQWREAGAQP